MKKRTDPVEQQVRALIGNYLLPPSATVEDLKIEYGDLLIFKEHLDIAFGDIFNVQALSSCNTIEEITAYVSSKVNEQPGDAAKTISKADVGDEIGFLIFDLSTQLSEKTNWDNLPQPIRKLFSSVLNPAIDTSLADIAHYKQELYSLSYGDADADFSALYIIYKEQIIFIHEN